MALYCAIPRDYLSDTPLFRSKGVLVSQHGQLGAIPPPPFLSVSPLESMRNGGAIPAHKRGISAILARYPLKQGKTRVIPPSAILSRKGIVRYGGVSRIGPLPGTSKLLCFLEEAQPSGAGVRRGVSKGSPHNEKRNNFLKRLRAKIGRI